MFMQDAVTRASRRTLFYARGALLDAMPFSVFRRRLAALGPQIEEAMHAGGEIADRVGYYNRMRPAELPAEALPVSRMQRRQSYFYYDLKIPAKHFGPDRRVAYVFGDVTEVPDMPAFVKSRPIHGDNANSVLFRLNGLRHFDLHARRDRIRFRDKKPLAVWRGDLNHEQRMAIILSHWEQPYCDVGHISDWMTPTGYKPFMPTGEQLQHRFVISVEGRDVATNLKWIMASNSLCLMARPRFETWYMEGRLEAGVHYAELRDDFSDLGEKIAFYNDNPAAAEEIIANANAYRRRFNDPRREELCKLAVLQKYFRLTGQE